MNTKHPSLADVITAHLGPECGCSGPYESPTERAQHIADMWRYNRTITSTEQLDALPHRSVVRTALGSIAQRYGDTAVFIGAYPDDYHWENLTLPAVLMHHPDWDTEPHTERP